MSAPGTRRAAQRAGFQQHQLARNDAFQVPERYQNLQRVGGGTFGVVWSVTFCSTLSMLSFSPLQKTFIGLLSTIKKMTSLIQFRD